MAYANLVVAGNIVGCVVIFGVPAAINPEVSEEWLTQTLL